MMRSDQIKKIAIVAVAGLACSSAMAQKQVKIAASTPVVNGDSVKVEEARPARVIQQLAPTGMYYRGQYYPLGQGSSAGDTTNNLIYENGTAATAANFYTTSVPNNHLMDEVTFFPGPGEGAGRLINGIQFAFGFAAATYPANLTQPIAVRVRIWDTVNITLGTAVANTTDLDGDVTFVFNPPVATGTWTLNGFYLSNMIDLSTLAGGGIQTLDDNVGVDLLFLTTDAGGQPTTTINTEMTTLMGDFTAGFGNTVGSSPAAYWRDTLNDNIFQSGDGNRTFGYPAVANFVLAVQAKVAPLVTGSCCLKNGTCVVASSYECTNKGGVYGGDGSVCGTCTGTVAVLYNNGPLATGATTGSGVAAPVGSTGWSELANDGVSVANTTLGYADANVNATTVSRLSDNFTVTDPAGWDIKNIVVDAYQSISSATAATTFKSANLQIWNGAPNAGGTLVFGDTTTNRLVASFNSGLMRTGNTTLPAAAAPSVVRPLFENWLSVNTVLPPGTYWIDVQLNCTLPTAPTVANNSFVPALTVPGSRTTAGANAIQATTAATTWAAILDGGLNQDINFQVRGSVAGSSCYANCDGSTANPTLTANDFQCFLNAFAQAQLPYANCDGSTAVPLLTANDFQCFLNAYAAGCT